MDFQFTIHSVVDYIIGIILIFGIFRGYTQGFIVQAISLFTLLAGTYISVSLSMSFYYTLVDKSNVPLRNLPVITFSLLFAVVFFAANWVGVYVKKMVLPVKINLYARVVGALLGAIKYLFIISVILIFMQRLDESFDIFGNTAIEKAKSKDKSVLTAPVSKFAAVIIPKLKFEIRQTEAVELEDIAIEPEDLD